jgi:hypothetical protein
MKWLSTGLTSVLFFFAVLFAIAVVDFLSALIEVYEITAISLPKYEQSGKSWIRKIVFRDTIFGPAKTSSL